MADGIHNRIRSARKNCGLTQGELADLLGIQPQTVGKWERGESEPDISYCCSLARLLGVSIDALLLSNEAGAPPPEHDCTAEDFRNALKKRRVFCGYSQTELARLLGIRSQTVSKWECGICLPDLSTVCKLCETYGVSPTDLCFAQDVRTAEEARAKEEQMRQESVQLLQGDGAPVVAVRPFGIKRIVALCVAVVATVLAIVLGVYFSVRQPQDTMPQKNLYQVVLHIFGEESETVSVYEGNTANVDDPVPPPNYRFIGWALRDEVTWRYPRNGMVIGAKNMIQFKGMPIYAHCEYEAVYQYEWFLDPVQYYDEGEYREQEEQYYKECLKLEAFGIAYYKWLVNIRDALFEAYKISADEKDTQVIRNKFIEKITDGDSLFIKQPDGTYVTSLKEKKETLFSSDPKIETDKFTELFDMIVDQATVISNEIFLSWEADAATAISVLCERIRTVFHDSDLWANSIKFKELYLEFLP